jgi:hypothetical protein
MAKVLAIYSGEDENALERIDALLTQGDPRLRLRPGAYLLPGINTTMTCLRQAAAELGQGRLLWVCVEDDDIRITRPPAG